MRDRKALGLVKRLCSEVPSGFKCLENCSQCCKTPIQMLRVEWEALKRSSSPALKVLCDDKVEVAVQSFPGVPTLVRISLPENGWCPFLDKQTMACRILDQRPFVCRQYGQHWLMRCEKGVPCPPEAELPIKTIMRYVALVEDEEGDGLPQGVTWEEFEKIDAVKRKVTAEWRRRGGRPDGVPDPEVFVEIARELLSDVDLKTLRLERLS